jgi:serine/threonine protein phosphatase PrpC
MRHVCPFKLLRCSSALRPSSFLAVRFSSTLAFQSAVCALPREDTKVGFPRASEDAYFVLRAPDGTFSAGVSDGVGGLRGHGVDPGAFSSALMTAAAGAAAAGAAPRAALKRASAAVLAARTFGGATALLFRASTSGDVACATIGDCTLFVADESGRVVSATERQLKKFDTPAQLGLLPPEAPPVSFDDVRAALDFSATVARGWTLIACTDGLTDNVFQHEIEAIIQSGAAGSARTLARALVARARAGATDRSRDSPFSLAAKDADILWRAGGRADDISVLVVRVVSSADGAEDTEDDTGDDAALDVLASHLVPRNAAARCAPEQVLAQRHPRADPRNKANGGSGRVDARNRKNGGGGRKSAEKN